jgi:two-component system KDP operon response regulator KdpE
VSAPKPKGPSILVVDNDRAVRVLVRRRLAAAGYRVHGSEFVLDALGMIDKTKPDLILIDFDQEAGGGRAAVRLVRETSPIPVLALSIHGDEDTTVDALDSGADDCIRKPFGTRELLARVRNALRRRALEQGKLVPLVGGDLEIDLIHRRVRSRGRDIYLSKKRYEVLRVLAEGAGKVIAHEAILRAVWSASIDRIGYLRVAIRELRRDLEPDPANPKHILTEPRVGYRLVVATRPTGVRR